MAQSNWDVVANSIGSGSIRRGSSGGIPRPPGGGSHAGGFFAADAAPGCAAYYCVESGCAPTTAGSSIGATIAKWGGAGSTNYSGFLFSCLQGNDVGAAGYMLGLGSSDGTSFHAILRKGALSEGLPDVAPGNQGVLLRSTDILTEKTHYQLRLDAIVNTNGDVWVRCYWSDLDAHAADAPSWEPIPGMEYFVDDQFGFNSNELGVPDLPYTSGYLGWGMQKSAIRRLVIFDNIQIGLQ